MLHVILCLSLIVSSATLCNLPATNPQASSIASQNNQSDPLQTELDTLLEFFESPVQHEILETSKETRAGLKRLKIPKNDIEECRLIGLIGSAVGCLLHDLYVNDRLDTVEQDNITHAISNSLNTIWQRYPTSSTPVQGHIHRMIASLGDVCFQRMSVSPIMPMPLAQLLTQQEFLTSKHEDPWHLYAAHAFFTKLQCGRITAVELRTLLPQLLERFVQPKDELEKTFCLYLLALYYPASASSQEQMIKCHQHMLDASQAIVYNKSKENIFGSDGMVHHNNLCNLAWSSSFMQAMVYLCNAHNAACFQMPLPDMPDAATMQALALMREAFEPLNGRCALIEAYQQEKPATPGISSSQLIVGKKINPFILQLQRLLEQVCEPKVQQSVLADVQEKVDALPSDLLPYQKMMREREIALRFLLGQIKQCFVSYHQYCIDKPNVAAAIAEFASCALRNIYLFRATMNQYEVDMLQWYLADNITYWQKTAQSITLPHYLNQILLTEGKYLIERNTEYGCWVRTLCHALYSALAEDTIDDYYLKKGIPALVTYASTQKELQPFEATMVRALDLWCQITQARSERDVQRVHAQVTDNTPVILPADKQTADLEQRLVMWCIEVCQSAPLMTAARTTLDAYIQSLQSMPSKAFDPHNKALTRLRTTFKYFDQRCTFVAACSNTTGVMPALQNQKWSTQEHAVYSAIRNQAIQYQKALVLSRTDKAAATALLLTHTQSERSLALALRFATDSTVSTEQKSTALQVVADYPALHTTATYRKLLQQLGRYTAHMLLKEITAIHETEADYLKAVGLSIPLLQSVLGSDNAAWQTTRHGILATVNELTADERDLLVILMQNAIAYESAIDPDKSSCFVDLPTQEIQWRLLCAHIGSIAGDAHSSLQLAEYHAACAAGRIPTGSDRRDELTCSHELLMHALQQNSKGSYSDIVGYIRALQENARRQLFAQNKLQAA